MLLKLCASVGIWQVPIGKTEIFYSPFPTVVRQKPLSSGTHDALSNLKKTEEVSVMTFGKRKWIAWSGLISTLVVATSLEVSAQITAYPAQGQSPQQQQMDKAACEDFAKSQTGFDPQQALAQAGTQGTQTPPPALRARKRAREEKQELSQENKQKAQMEQKLQAYNKAETVCLQGKGYSVG
jgi:hypothetical protein